MKIFVADGANRDRRKYCLQHDTRTAAEAPRCQIRAALEAACLEHVPLPEDVKRRVGWTPGSRAARPCPDRTPPHERWVL